ncbi:ATP-dependent helicase [Candidatus Similichlamydia laticola]|uniref:DNA 3'-5' helicase n=1 Tax=Candidatus Similichlamydia laticola TaxID=2170265 RepID=A0A369KCG2_9BACT|nr:UvrD-helicase domain-containing protein [Candidatus Similichlamydia laticola]RDB31140.1 ATP-dependent DNA helicase UvrD/PcrA [Candidatus Similichlamydia laticola]
MHFNKQQQEILLHTEGPLLVLAGAGTGKTTVLTSRLDQLVNHHCIAPEQILTLTFTNQAAREMRFRIRKKGVEGSWIGTFHRLGHDILRRCLPARNIPQTTSFSIYDEEDRRKVLRSLLEREQSSLSCSFLEQFLKERKNNGLSNEAWDLQEEKNRLYLLYEEQLRQANALDLDDLLLKPLELFQAHPDILHQYRSQWLYLLVDEYQDTNVAQAEMLFLLGQPHYNICFVGDPDQAIYSWRGATIRNILNLPKVLRNTRILPLEQNYRSTNIILKAANQLISHNQNRLHKTLWSQLGEGVPPIEYIAPSDLEEAAQVVQSILEMKEEGLSFGQIAVLYRTHAISKSIEDALLRKGIPYTIFGGPSFYQRKETKDALAFLQILHSPQNSCAAERLLDLLPGVGKKCKGRLMIHLRETGNFLRALEKGIAPCFKATQQQRNSLTTLSRFLSKLSPNTLPLSLLIQDIIQSDLLHNSLKEPIEERRQQLDEFFLRTVNWETQVPQLSIEEFLSTIALSSEKKEKGEAHERVQLMTIHYAKGLEFEAVFLVGLEEGVFPIGEESLEEERRLCYVGMTRAKRYLVLTHAQKRILWGSLRFQRPSRFLEEITDEFLDRTFLRPHHPFKPFPRHQS